MKTKIYIAIILTAITAALFAQPQMPFTANSNNPVVVPGEQGSWDQGLTFASDIISVDGIYYLFYGGIENTVPGSAPISLGYATSMDGKVFTKVTIDEPIFEADGTGFDAWSVDMGAILYEDSEWTLYYAGTAEESLVTPNSIGKATASDINETWERLEDPILEVGSPGTWDSHFIFPVSVVKTVDEYLLFYWGGNMYPDGLWQIGLAISEDGEIWTKYDDPSTTSLVYSESDPVLKPGISGSWDDNDLIGCEVLRTQNGFEMFYCGNSYGQVGCAIGYATSSDGIFWIKDISGPVFTYHQDPYANNNAYYNLELPSVLIHDSTYYLSYDYYGYAGEIGMATAPASVQTIHVPGDQPTIQEAINVATDGDTVLVDQGTYYENIKFRGKAITVASNYIDEPDSAHIYNTIIDGSQAMNANEASAVMFVNGEDTTSVLCGFTITGGAGYYNTNYNAMHGGGVCIENSGAKIENNIIANNEINNEYIAGGVGIGAIDLQGEKWLVVRNNIIHNNKATAVGMSAFGGGIASSLNSIIENNIIEYNECENTGGGQVDGGGIEIEQLPNSNPIVAHIKNNIVQHNELQGYQSMGAGMSMLHVSEVYVYNNEFVNNIKYF